MTDRKETGNRGEGLAADYLTGLGYRIVRRNYRFRRTEVDLIAWDGDILVFIEVKTRTTTPYGPPGTFYTPAQQRRTSRAAAAYMEEIDYDWEIRFDLVAILYRAPADYDLTHFPDVFFPGLH